MKQLTGYVLVRETNAGVGGVVVAAYDFKDGSRTGGDEKTHLVQHLGRPLGSVVSDAQGQFQLTIASRATETRLNIVVAVFAPEDARSIDDPRPEPAEKRLMFMSRDARDDAAPQETFIIRLLQAQLAHYGIESKPAPDAPATRRAQAGDAMEAAWTEATYFRDRFKDRIADDVAARLKRREAAKRAVHKLSGIPLHLRDGETRNPFQDNSLLIADRRDLARRLPDMQHRAISEGLKRLQKRKRKPITRLYLSTAEVKSLGLSIDAKTGRITGEVPAEKFREKVRAAIGGYSITKTPRAAKMSIADLRDRYLALEEASPAKSPQTPSARCAPSTPTPSPSARKKTGRRPNSSNDA